MASLRFRRKVGTTLESLHGHCTDPLIQAFPIISVKVLQTMSFYENMRLKHLFDAIESSRVKD